MQSTEGCIDAQFAWRAKAGNQPFEAVSGQSHQELVWRLGQLLEPYRPSGSSEYCTLSTCGTVPRLLDLPPAAPPPDRCHWFTSQKESSVSMPCIQCYYQGRYDVFFSFHPPVESSSNYCSHIRHGVDLIHLWRCISLETYLLNKLNNDTDSTTLTMTQSYP